MQKYGNLNSHFRTTLLILVFFLPLSVGYPLLAMPSAAFPTAKSLPDLNRKPKELPLTILPVSENNELPMVFFISGDGGWIKTDAGVTKLLNEHGMPVVGLNSLKYFWKEKKTGWLSS